MPNYTREELVNKTATMNQMRNNLYHFLRYLMSKGFSNQEILQKMHRMGKNIANTILEDKAFQGQNLEEVITSVYSDMFESKVIITYDPHHLTIEDKKCPLCKYKREDLKIAPCKVITSLVSEICKQCGHDVKDSSVKKSAAFGDISCVHIYELPERDE